jgi:hypothetical protein
MGRSKRLAQSNAWGNAPCCGAKPSNSTTKRRKMTPPLSLIRRIAGRPRSRRAAEILPQSGPLPESKCSRTLSRRPPGARDDGMPRRITGHRRKQPTCRQARLDGVRTQSVHSKRLAAWLFHQRPARTDLRAILPSMRICSPWLIVSRSRPRRYGSAGVMTLEKRVRGARKGPGAEGP